MPIQKENTSNKILVENDEAKPQTSLKNDRYKAFILFMALQEMIKQVFLECK